MYCTLQPAASQLILETWREQCGSEVSIHIDAFFSLLICQTWLTGFSLWYTGINPSSDQNKHWINANPLIVIMKAYVGYGGSLACRLPMRNRPAGFISGTSLVFTSIVIAAVITNNNVVLICAIIFGGNKSLYRTQRQKNVHIFECYTGFRFR